jgi:hypothetical protein
MARLAALSRTQKLVALAGALIAVIAVVLILVLSGGDDYVEFEGDLADLPVSNLAGGITEEAHEELEACGFSDEEAKDLVETPATEPSGASVVNRHDAEGELIGSIRMRQVDYGIVLFDCQEGPLAPGETP